MRDWSMRNHGEIANSLPNTGSIGLDRLLSDASFSEHFEEPRGPHAAAHAHGDNHITGIAPFAFNERMTYEPSTRHPIGMPH